MLGTKLYWISGDWPGRLALAARPRGGEWLSDELRAWRKLGIDLVVSLLTASEERDLELGKEAKEVASEYMGYITFPIADRQVPSSEIEFTRFLEKLDQALSLGKNVVVHCRQGIGRAGMVLVCLLIMKGLSPGAAIEQLTMVRGAPIPETSQQRDWIERFAVSIAGSK
jgi:protein-tyrosine phosphatase